MNPTGVAFVALLAASLTACSHGPKYEGEYDGTMDSSYTGTAVGAKRVDKKQTPVHVSVTKDGVELKGAAIERCTPKVKSSDAKAMIVEIADGACKLSFDGKAIAMPKGPALLFVDGDALRFDYNPAGTSPDAAESTLFLKAQRTK